MIADLVATVLIYRSGGIFRAECAAFDLVATAGSPEDAKEEMLRLVRRRLSQLAEERELDAFLAAAGFVVDNGVLRTEDRLVSAGEVIVTVPL